MGGVVESIASGVGDAVSSVGDIGQGAINAVSDLGVSIDQGVRNTLGPNGWTLAALMAAGYYYAPEIGAYMNAAGETVPASAVVDAGSTANAAVAADNGYLASQGVINNVMGTSPVTTGTVTATQLPALGETLAPLSPVVPALNSTTALSAVAPVTAEGAAAGGLGATGTGLLGGAVDWAKANPLQAATLGLTASKALGGSTPSSSTSTTNIDPDVKAAYLRNLEEARATAAGLGTKQFAPYPEYNLGMVQKYMNPYENNVVQNALADIERARQGQISQEGAAATAAKAFGGSRQAVTRSLVDEAALRNAGNLAAQLRQTGFAQAQNLGLSQQQLKQQYEQQKLDAARNLGLERLNVAQGALSLQPANLGGSTTTPIYRNQTASALGGALGGASLGSLFGGTSGAQYGALAGGLLGFL